jgi:RNase adapter protein RapZ
MFGVERDFKGKQFYIVTGLSGAGKTSLMRALEDSGFYCVDNLPLPLLSAFLNLMFQSQTNLVKVALGIDARGQKFLNNFISEVERLRKQNNTEIIFKIIFLSASEDVLVKRFQETRRNHPLATSDISLLAAIRKEKEILEPIRHMADMILNTDIFNVHELRRWVRNFFTDESEREVLVNLISFGFKFGVPAESNLVYDLRFLPNPYFEPTIKAFDGRNEAIQNYLFTNPVVNEYWEKLEDFLKYSVQKFYQEGRFFVHVAIGCTGGKHRSVAFVEKLGKQKWDNVRFLIQHRDLGKE